MLNLQEMYDYIDSQEETMMKLWRNIVEIESWSSDLEGVKKLADHLDTYFDAMGMNTRKYIFENAGPSLAASNRPGRLAPIALMGHMDTVHKPGSFGKDLFVKKDDGMIHGPGVYDCKGGVVVAILVAKTLIQFGYTDRQIRIILSGDEEVAHELSGGKGKEVYVEESRGAAAAFNFESGRENGDVVTRRRGGSVMKVIVHGVSAHAGNNPLNGASAIQEAAKMALAIEGMNDYENTYFNVGQISGGVGSNVIPDTCEMVVSARFATNAGFDEAIAKVREICAHPSDPRITAEVKLSATFNAMEPTDKTEKLFQKYADACEKLGLPRPAQKYVGGCSDAAYTTMVGIPTLCAVGVQGADNHALTERAVPSSICEQAKKVVTTILSLDEDF